MKLDNSQRAFFELLKAGLWADTTVNDSWFMVHGSVQVDWEKVYQLSEEQSVLGLVLAGIEKKNTNRTDNTNRPQQELLLQWIGEVQLLEQQNKAMNIFVAKLIEKLRKEDIYAILVKGQGIAQCYEKPLLRSSGDVDLLLSEGNYNRATTYLSPLASDVEKEYQYKKHQAMTIDSWVVELHGSLRGGLSSKIDGVLDNVQKNIFYSGNVRSWMNGKSQLFLPGVDCDVVFVFSHLLKHFYKGGLGVRQVCDWCRLIWTYRSKLDVTLLERRLRNMGLMSEWKAFGAFAVEYLGMQSDVMPLYSADAKWKRKADKICSFILEVGNMGHNRDMNYIKKYPYLIRKTCSMGRRCGDLFRHAMIFPMDSFRFFPYMMFNGFREAFRKS